MGTDKRSVGVSGGGGGGGGEGFRVPWVRGWCGRNIEESTPPFGALDRRSLYGADEPLGDDPWGGSV
jgi:hypothetical protein